MDAFESRLRTELQPEFELLRLLGEGAVSRVYLARMVDLKILVALKVLRPGLVSDETTLKRFRREAQAIAQIRHDNVARVLHVLSLDDGLPVQVIEYVDGSSLEEILAGEGPLSVEEARRTMTDMANALAAAHARGIIHRDVRPANILRENGTGRLVLADFGIAAILATGSGQVTKITQVGDLVGNVRYMSPEQLRGEPPTPSADVYGLGVTIFELLTGKWVYRVPPGESELTAPLRCSPEEVSVSRPEVDRLLASLLMRCLAKEPTRRPSAEAVARQLESGEEEETAEFPAFVSFLRELRRRRVYRAAAGYAAAAFVILEGSDIVVSALRAPDWTLTVLVALVLAGFPVTLMLSWVFQVTRSGVERTDAAPGTAESSTAIASSSRRGGLRLPPQIIASLPAPFPRDEHTCWESECAALCVGVGA